ncbi:MAG TPA: HTTM domain-containing protein [Polyangiaceae bacterium]|nr:HTTM domain-containing protein [Polyangiaceae bacterium]
MPSFDRIRQLPFGPRVSLRALGMYRILLGATCSYDLARRWWVLDAFGGDQSLYPRALQPTAFHSFGWLSDVGTAGTLSLAIGLCLLSCLLFTAGVATRWTRFMLLPALLLVHDRFPVLTTGGEVVLHWSALYAALLPVGERYSVDHWRERRRGVTGTESSTEPSSARTPIVWLVWFQLAVIYLFNFLAKDGTAWRGGSALAQALNATSLCTPLGAWIARAPSHLLTAATYGTLVLEAALPLLLLAPWFRKQAHAAAAASMVALHLGIVLTLDVGIFSAAMLCHLPLLWHPADEQGPELAIASWHRKALPVLSALLLYVIGARLSHDLVLFRRTPWPFPAALHRLMVHSYVIQPWMMFSPDPPQFDSVVVTHAVTRSGLVFDPYRQRMFGVTPPLAFMPESAVRSHLFTRFDNQLTTGREPRSMALFADWSMRQHALGHPDDPVEYLDVWLFKIATQPGRILPDAELDERVGVRPLPFPDRLPVKALASRGVWRAELATDGSIVPDQTHVHTPVTANFSAGCPWLRIELAEGAAAGAPAPRMAYLQADSADSFLLEGSLDGTHFELLTKVPPVRKASQLTSRLVSWSPRPLRYVRVRPTSARSFYYYLSEIALFDHEVTLPEIAKAPLSHDYYTSRQRPSTAGLISAARTVDPACPAEQTYRELTRSH